MELMEAVVFRNLTALEGGLLIGLSASIFLLFNGRIAGISGIVGGLVAPNHHGTHWRLAFLLGLLSGGVITLSIAPQSLGFPPENRPLWLLACAGFLIGFGTALAQGCTSGHGICGLARRAPRSLAATLIFMLAGVLTATGYARYWG